MASNILIFPAANSPANSHPTPHLARQHAEPAAPSRPRRIHLCDRNPCEPAAIERTLSEPTSRPLDLASQVGLTVSHVHRRMTEHTARERQRLYFNPSDDTPDIPA